MIWFDFENSPHVQVFRPVLNRLQAMGYECDLTARDFAQTYDLLSYWHLPFAGIGKYAGKNRIRKVLATVNRALHLRRYMQERPRVSLAVSHGSRSQVLAAKMLGVPSLLMLDYEFTESYIFNAFSDQILVPKFIPEARLEAGGIDLRKVIRFSGFKEELYLQDFVPEPRFRARLDVADDAILAVVRPPSLVGHYHDVHSEPLLRAAFDYLGAHPEVRCLVVNRTEGEKSRIAEMFSKYPNCSFLEHPVDGLQLLAAADIAISGGGTMNRESALLGTPTYSLFTGNRPYLDEYLAREEKLVFVERASQIQNIPLRRKAGPPAYTAEFDLVGEVCNIILELTGTVPREVRTNGKGTFIDVEAHSAN